MTKEPAHTPRWLWSANDKARSSNRYIVRLFHFELRAGVGSSGIGPVRSDMKTGDLAGPDRRLGTNFRTRSTPAGYRTFLLNFARPDGDLPRICARKISALRGDTRRVFIEMGHFEARFGSACRTGVWGQTSGHDQPPQ